MSIDLINEFGQTLTVTRYGSSVQTVVLTFDADFIIGNSIDLDIDLTAITSIPFNVTHAQTLIDLAVEIESSSKIDSAIITGAREVTILAVEAGSDLLINGIMITGGLSQAEGSITQSGGFIDGVYQEGATSTFDIVMSVQPLNGKELEILAQGERTKRFVKGYTTTRLYTVKENDSKRADVVAYDDTRFEVQSVERWVDGNLQHYKTFMAEVNG